MTDCSTCIHARNINKGAKTCECLELDIRVEQYDDFCCYRHKEAYEVKFT